MHARVAAARDRLRQAGIAPEEADLSARMIAEHVLGWDAARFFTSADEPAPSDFKARYEALVRRRAAREPTAYITGRQEFWGMSFAVSPSVLIPRPETELLVEAALEQGGRDRHRSLAVADACTGSGCVAVALACELPNARVAATDLSLDALGVARTNAARHAVADRIQLVQTDLVDGLAGPFDVIVSNPPYVPNADRQALPREVRDYEPALALFAGPTGLDAIRRLLAAAASRLGDGGTLAFEFGFGQAAAVRELIGKTAGLRMVDLRRDLQAIERVAIARKKVS